MVVSVSVIGLGKLGLPLAASFAEQGFNVVGVDNNPKVIESVNAGQAHIYEPGLPELLVRVVKAGQLRATMNVANAVAWTDVTFVLVPTPSQADKRFTNKFVLQVCKALRPELDKKPGHVVAISSTVMPGSCDGPIRHVLGDAVGLCYCPEFVALGNTIAGFQRPDFVLIGQSDVRAGDVMEGVYKAFCTNRPPILRTNLVNAELAKVNLNFAVTAKISVANTIGEECEGFPGASADEVTRIIGHDSRIGHKYFKAGTAFGGACFPRDVGAVIATAIAAGTWSPLAEAVHKVNRYQNVRLTRIIDSLEPQRVGVLGLTFKPGTDVTEESVGMFLVEHYGERCVAYDPLVACPRSEERLRDCVDFADVVVVTIMLPEFRDVSFCEGQTVIDCWRYLDREKVEAQGARYIGLGLGERI